MELNVAIENYKYYLNQIEIYYKEREISMTRFMDIVADINSNKIESAINKLGIANEISHLALQHLNNKSAKLNKDSLVYELFDFFDTKLDEAFPNPSDELIDFYETIYDEGDDWNDVEKLGVPKHIYEEFDALAEKYDADGGFDIYISHVEQYFYDYVDSL
jgi:hypothetical protein